MQADRTTARLSILGGSQGPVNHALRITVLGHLTESPHEPDPTCCPSEACGAGAGGGGVRASPACPPQACRSHCLHPRDALIPCSGEDLALSLPHQPPGEAQTSGRAVMQARPGCPPASGSSRSSQHPGANPISRLRFPFASCSARIDVEPGQLINSVRVKLGEGVSPLPSSALPSISSTLLFSPAPVLARPACASRVTANFLWFSLVR